MHRLVATIALVAFAGWILVVRESRRHIDGDAAHGVARLFEGVQVDTDEIVNPDAEKVREERILDRSARVDRAPRLRPLAEPPRRVREVDALLRGLAVAERDGHVPVARDRDLRNLG